MTWILAVIATEALVEFFVNAEIFDKTRKAISKVKFLKDLFECGYCLSVWMALFVFGILLLKIEIILVPIVIHRTSNYVHSIYSFLRRK